MKAHAARESIDTKNRVVYNSHRIRKKERKGQMNVLQGMREKRRWILELVLWGTVLAVLFILISLCFDHGIDLDEAYSYRTVHGNDLKGIMDNILEAHDTDIPLWYWGLRVWTWIFGESWFAYKLFSVAGSFATLLLGATAVKKAWGYRTALLFIVPAGLAPALLHIGVNVRMYSWTVFIVTACGITIYYLAKEPKRRLLWGILFLLTVSGLFCHYFTAFCFLFLYLYLFLALWNRDRRSVWKVFVCGIAAVAPFCWWLVVSDFFHLKEQGETQVDFGTIDFQELFSFIFKSNIEHSTLLGMGILAMAFAGLFLLWDRFEKADRSFALLCLSLLFVSYLIAAVLASVSSHFFISRHIMHGLALMWLGIAIVLSRINPPVYICALLFVGIMSMSSYRICYANEYTTTPYIEETKAFIEEQMEPGDIVIYNSEPAFDLLYGCYMPEQTFIYYPELTDIQVLAGKRVWFFLCKPDFFSEEVQEVYGITYENRGHYGFQIINDCTDFDLLRLNIKGAEEGHQAL